MKKAKDFKLCRNIFLEFCKKKDKKGFDKWCQKFPRPLRQWNTAILLKAHSCERRIHFYVTVLGDIDPEFNVVEVTDEAKEKLSKIKNKIGGFGCKLCKREFEDAFGLAQHRYLFSFHAQSEKYYLRL